VGNDAVRGFADPVSGDLVLGNDGAVFRCRRPAAW
jgi:hypothetical protein